MYKTTSFYHPLCIRNIVTDRDLLVEKKPTKFFNKNIWVSNTSWNSSAVILTISFNYFIAIRSLYQSRNERLVELENEVNYCWDSLHTKQLKKSKINLEYSRKSYTYIVIVMYGNLLIVVIYHVINFSTATNKFSLNFRKDTGGHRTTLKGSVQFQFVVVSRVENTINILCGFVTHFFNFFL